MNLFKKLLDKFSDTAIIVTAIAIFVIACGGYLYLSALAKQRTLSASPEHLVRLPTADDPLITKVPRLKDTITAPIIDSDQDPSRGTASAQVTITIFSDFTCGFCAKQEKLLHETLARYDSKVRLIRKDYPEGNLTSASWQAAIAGRCAQAQNAFWPVHDLILTVGTENLTSILPALSSVYVDIDKFDACMTESQPVGLIYDNIEEANALGINGVPYIFVNEQPFMGEVTEVELMQAIDTELKK